MKVKINFVDMGIVPEVVKLFQDDFIRLIGTFAEVEISDDPDFLFCGSYGDKHLDYKCVKIFHQSEELEPDFDEYDYAICQGNHIYYDRSFWRPDFVSPRFRDITLRALKKHEMSDEFFLGKERFCNFVYTNAAADPFRDKVFFALDAYKHVDSAGQHLYNMKEQAAAGARYTPTWQADKIEFLKKYRFTIAMENAQKKGYMDEKVFDAWSAGSIPVFWGDPTLREIFNPEAYIDCCDCASADEVVERVRRIEEDEAAYLYMQKQPILAPNSKWWDIIIENRTERELIEFLKRIMTQEPWRARRVSNGVLARVKRRDQKVLSTLKTTIPYRLYRKITTTQETGIRK